MTTTPRAYNLENFGYSRSILQSTDTKQSYSTINSRRLMSAAAASASGTPPPGTHMLPTEDTSPIPAPQALPSPSNLAPDTAKTDHDPALSRPEASPYSSPVAPTRSADNSQGFAAPHEQANTHSSSATSTHSTDNRQGSAAPHEQAYIHSSSATSDSSTGNAQGSAAAPQPGSLQSPPTANVSPSSAATYQPGSIQPPPTANVPQPNSLQPPSTANGPITAATVLQVKVIPTTPLLRRTRWQEVLHATSVLDNCDTLPDDDYPAEQGIRTLGSWRFKEGSSLSVAWKEELHEHFQWAYEICNDDKLQTKNFIDEMIKVSGGTHVG